MTGQFSLFKPFCGLLIAFCMLGTAQAAPSVCDYYQSRYTTPLQAAQAWHGFAQTGISSALPESCAQQSRLQELHKELATQLAEVSAIGTEQNDPLNPEIQEALAILKEINEKIADLQFLHSRCATELLGQSDYLLLLTDTLILVNPSSSSIAVNPLASSLLIGVTAYVRAYENRAFDMEKQELRQTYLGLLCASQRLKDKLHYLRSQLTGSHALNQRVQELAHEIESMDESPTLLTDRVLQLMNILYDSQAVDTRMSREQLFTPWIAYKASLDPKILDRAIESLHWAFDGPDSAFKLPKEREELFTLTRRLQSGTFSHASLAEIEARPSPIEKLLVELDTVYSTLDQIRQDNSEINNNDYLCYAVKNHLSTSTANQDFMALAGSLAQENQQLGYTDQASRDFDQRLSYLAQLRENLLQNHTASNSNSLTPSDPLPAQEEIIQIEARQSSPHCHELAQNWLNEMTLLLADLSFEAGRSDRETLRRKNLMNSPLYIQYQAWLSKGNELKKSYEQSKSLLDVLSSHEITRSLETLAQSHVEITELLFEEESRALMDHQLDRSPTLAWLRHLQISAARNTDTFSAIARNTRDQPHPSEVNTYLNPATLPNICAAMSTARAELKKAEIHLRMGLEFCREFHNLVTQGNHSNMEMVCQKFPPKYQALEENFVLKQDSARLLSWMQDAECPQIQQQSAL